jgi:hypothetical protein
MDSLKIKLSGFFIHLIQSFTKKSGISSNPAEALPFNLDTTVTISSSEIGKNTQNMDCSPLQFAMIYHYHYSYFSPQVLLPYQ